MEYAKLTVRIPRDLLENMKRYAAENNTTLTKLIEVYFRRIPVRPSLENGPIVQRLSGAISPNVTLQDYENYLEKKYDQ